MANTVIDTHPNVVAMADEHLLYDTQRDAIVSAMDDMEVGDTLYVHTEQCTMAAGKCTCTPRTWTY